MLNSLIAALSFLTIMPLPARELREEDLTGSVRFFPLVGMLLGVMAAGIASCVYALLPAWPGSVILVITITGFSGGLHLDGLADTADALMSSRTRERMLEIMHDSHVGTMGVLAITGIILLKVAAFASLARILGPLAIVTAAITPLAGRVCLVVALLLQQPYARDAGLGKAYFANRTWHEAIVAVLVLAGVGFAGLGTTGLVGALLACAAVAILSLHCKRKLGGGTGDTVGAANEIGEALFAIVVLAITHREAIQP